MQASNEDNTTQCCFFFNAKHLSADCKWPKKGFGANVFFPFAFRFFSYFSESDATQRPSFFPSDVWTQFSSQMEFIDDRVLMSAHFYTAFPEMWFFLLLLLMLPLFALGRFFFLLAISAQEAIKCYQAASKIHTKRQSIDNDRAWVIKSKVKVIVIMFCNLEVCIAKGRGKKNAHIGVLEHDERKKTNWFEFYWPI